MPDVFDTLEEPKQDIFDQVGQPVDVFDQVSQPSVSISDSDISALTSGPTSPVQASDESQFLTKSSPTLAEFGTPFLGEPAAFENEAVQSKEDFERAYQTPLVTLPKPENTGIVSGVTRGLETGVESQFTGFNAALLAGLPHLPASAQRLVSAGFGVHMIQGAYDQFEEALKATTPGEKAEKFTEALTSLLFGGLAGKHALSRPGGGGAAPKERVGTLTQEQVDSSLTPKVIREGQTQALLDESGYRQESLSREVQNANPEVIDNLVLSREKLSENFNTLPEEIKAERQKSLDDIDAQLLQMDRGAVQAAEARVRERGLSKAQAKPAEPPDTTGGPPENTGRSKLFEQARREQEVTESTPEQRIRSAYDELIQEKGFPAVPIQEVIDRSWVDADVVKNYLADTTKSRTVLSRGDWSIASPREREGVIKLQGEDKLQVRFLDNALERATTPETTAKPVEIDPVMAKSAMDSANTIADSVTKGQPTSVRDAAYNAALDNAMSSLRSGKNPSASFMRKSAQEAAGKAVRPEESLDAPRGESDQSLVETMPTPEPTRAFDAEAQGGIDRAELTPSERRIVDAVKGGEYESVAEAADALGISRQAASESFNSALGKLRSMGPGAASIDEFLKSWTTGIKNELVKSERELRGEDELFSEETLPNKQAISEAIEANKADPKRADIIIEDLLNSTRDVRSISVADEAILMVRKVELMKERAAQEAIYSDGNRTDAEHAVAAQELTRIEEKLNAVDQASRIAGTEGGRFLQLRQRLLREDFSLASMERKARIAKGDALTPEESDKIKEQSDRIAELEKQLAETQSKKIEKDAEKASDDSFSELKKKSKKPSGDSIKSERQKLSSALAKRVEDGDSIKDVQNLVQRLALNFVREGTKEREVLVDQVHRILKGLFPELERTQTRDLISGYGDFKPLDKEPAKVTLRELKGEMQQIGKIEDMQSGVAPKKTGQERRTMSDEERRLQKEVNELKKKGGFSVTDPETQLKTAMDAIKTRLRNEIRDIDTAIATQERIPGKKSQIEYDAEATALREQRDVKRKEYDEMFPKEPLTEERLIARALNNLDRSIATLESDIKSGNLYGNKGRRLTTPELEAKRARLDALRSERDTLRALDTEKIESKKEEALLKAIERAHQSLPSPGKTQTVDTPRIAELKRALQEVRDEMFPKEPLTEEQLIARASNNLDRSIAALESDIKSGKLYGDKGRRLTTPELEAKRARLEALRSDRDTLRDLDTDRVEAAKEAKLQKAIEDVQNALPKEKEGRPTADSPKVAELRLRLEAARKARADARNSDSQRREDAKIKSLEAAIKKAKEPFRETEKEQGADSPVVAELKRALQEVRDAKKSSPESMQAKLESATDAVKKRIIEIDRKLREGDFVTKAQPEQIRSNELDALRGERDAMETLLREERNKLKPRKTADEIALQSYKTRTANRIAELQERIAKGDFESRPRKELALDKEALDLKTKIEIEKEKFNEGVFKMRLKNRTIPEKIIGGIAETLNTTRAILTSIDFSAVLRQGGFIGLGNPIRSTKAIPDMVRAFFSKDAQTRSETQIKNRANYDLYEKSKLYLADQGTPSLTKMEEAYMSRIARKIPLVAGSERAYTTFLNRLRADTFDAMVNSMGGRNGVSIDEAKVISNYINAATGRGTAFGLDKSAAAMATVFFSPRYVASRFQMLVGEPLLRGSISGKFSPRAKAQIAKEYAKFLTGAAVVYGLGRLSGAKLEDDPRSSDFGKMKFGNTRVDLLTGLAQNTTLISRLYTDEKKTSSGKIQSLTLKEGEKRKPFQETTSDVLFRFARTKFSPLLGAFFDAKEGRNVIGQPVTKIDVAKNLVVPMSLKDVSDVMREQGIPKGTIFTILSLFGAGVQNYDTAKKDVR